MNFLRTVKSILNSYSIIFFSDKLLFAGLLLLASFLDYFAGLCGLVSVLTANVIAVILGFDKFKIEKGFSTRFVEKLSLKELKKAAGKK